ncbi:MAG: hypothetical protein AAF560_03275, partial [Acidobacteriota bacterium]
MQARAADAARSSAPVWSEHASPSALQEKDRKRLGSLLAASRGGYSPWTQETPTEASSLPSGLVPDRLVPPGLDLTPEKGVDDCEWQPGYGLASSDGPVFALATFDDGGGEALYAGGDFLSIGGVLTSSVAKWDGTSWSAVGAGLGGGVDGIVWALEVFDDGGGPALYAGGFFSTAGGVPASSIAKWDGTSWTALGLGIDEDVYAMEVFGGELIVGGFFATAGGSSADNIASWDGTAWSPVGAGTDGDVEELAVFDDGGGDDLYATGFFSFAGISPAFGIARWSGVSWSALDFGLDAPGLGLTVFDDGGGDDLYVGGLFFFVGPFPGVAAGAVARWDGTAWSALGMGLDGLTEPPVVDDLRVFDDGGGDALFVGGLFELAGGSPVSNIAKWDGAAWSDVGGGTDAPVITLNTFDDGGGTDLYAGGFFRDAGGIGAPGIARWDGAAWSAVVPAESLAGVDDFLSTFALFDDGSGEALYAGGEFLTAGGVLSPGIAKWTATGWEMVGGGVGCLGIGLGGMLQPEDTTDKGIIIGPPGCFEPSVLALAVYDDGGGPALFVGGEFDLADGSPISSNIAKWDGTSWSPVGTGTDDLVEALEVYDDGGGEDLYLGGEFDFASGVLSPYITRWDGTAFSVVGSMATDGDVETLGLFDDGTGEKLYAGGVFNAIGGVAADYVASWDGTTWAPLGLGTDDEVENFAVFDDGGGPALFVGGDFLMAGGAPASYVAKWDGTSWSPLGTGTDDEVNVLFTFDAGDGEQLYVG